MATGKQHGIITRELANVAILGSLMATEDIDKSILVFLGCNFGLFMCPDLDIDHKTASENRVYKINYYFGTLWYLIWLPYAKAIPHRHFISHYPVFGTIIRYMYLSTFILPILILIFGYDYIYNYINIYKYNIMYFILGTIISDIGHFIADKIKLPNKIKL